MITVCKERRTSGASTLWVLAFGIALALFGAGASAATFYVDGDAGSDAYPGDKWTSATQSIQQALALAQAAGGSNEVWVKGSAAGINYELSDSPVRLTSNTVVLGGFRAQGDGDTVRDPEVYHSLIQGTGAPGQLPASLVVLPAGLVNATLDGFTIAGGYSAGGSAAIGANATAGAIDSSNVISNCWITSNTAEVTGSLFNGGIIGFNAGAAPRLENCRVDGNTVSITNATGNHLGGIVLLNSAGQVTSFTNCTFNNNSVSVTQPATNRYIQGGILYLRAVVALDGCTIRDNTVTHLGSPATLLANVRGGVIQTNASNVTVRDTVVEGNSVTATGGIDGGAFYLGSGGGNVVTFSGGACSRTTVHQTGNVQNVRGAGVYLVNGTLNITDTAFVGNVGISNGAGASGTYGGAIGQNAGIVNATGAEIRDNQLIHAGTGSNYGAGYYMLAGTATLDGCMLTSNSLDRDAAVGSNTNNQGAGLYITNTTSFVARSCTFAANRIDPQSAAANNCYGAGAQVANGASVVFDACRFNGNASRTFGGGVSVLAGTTEFLNCAFAGNRAAYSSHAYVSTVSPLFAQCTFSESYRTGILTNGTASPQFVNCVFEGHRTDAVGAAIYEGSAGSDPVLINCLFDGNTNNYFDDDTTYTNTVAELNALPGCSGVTTAPANLVMRGPGAISGNWTAIQYTTDTNRTTLTDAGAAFVPGALVGQAINAKAEYLGGVYLPVVHIIDNTTTTIDVIGDVTDFVLRNNTYRVIDQQLGTGSGAVDQGIDSSSYDGSLVNDIAGRARYDDPGVSGPSAYDIGAFEYLVPPALTVDALVTSSTTPLLTGTVADNSGTGLAWLRVKVNGVSYIPAVAGNDWAATVTSALDNGDYDVVASARDNQGNTGVDATQDELTVNASTVGISISEPSVTWTETGPVSYTVTYTSATVVTLTESDVTLNQTGTANGTVAVSGSGTAERTVTISAISGLGSLGISIAPGTAANAIGTPAPAAGPSSTFDVGTPTATLEWAIYE